MVRRFLQRFVVALPLILLAFAPLPATAQESAASDAAAALSQSEIERLLHTLENAEERERFIRDLRGLVQAQRAVDPPSALEQDRLASRLLEGLSERVAIIGESMLSAAAFMADVPRIYAWLQDEVSDRRNRQRLVEIFSVVLGVLFAGWLAEFIVNRLLLGPRRWLETRCTGCERWARLPYAVLYALLAAVPVVAFAVVAFGTLTLTEPSRVARLVALALINANLLARAIMLVVGVLLSPRVAALRPLPLSDETAAYLHIWARRLTNIAVYGYFIAEAALLIGIPAGGHRFVLRSIGVIIGLLTVVLILQNRHAVAQAISAPPAPSPLDGELPETPPSEAARGTRRFIAAYWHIAAIAYVAVVFIVWLFHPDGGPFFVIRATLVTVLSLLLARLFVRVARGDWRICSASPTRSATASRRSRSAPTATCRSSTSRSWSPVTASPRW